MMPGDEMKKALIVLAVLAAFAGDAAAACYGTKVYQNCYDSQSGNSYSIQRYGNTTTMNGYNSNTGSTWNQNSYTYGNSTSHYGTDSDGNNWSTHCTNGICY